MSEELISLHVVWIPHRAEPCISQRKNHLNAYGNPTDIQSRLPNASLGEITDFWSQSEPMQEGNLGWKTCWEGQKSAEAKSPSSTEPATVHAMGLREQTLTLTSVQALPCAGTTLMVSCPQDTRVRMINYTAPKGGSVSMSMLLPLLLLFQLPKFMVRTMLGIMKRAEKA
jgi:hypothetical protein